ncbi:MAG TPA: cyclopropane-fatty-acyl-phospholipid synthase family protein [Gaiellales bacterium]|nr:cyclopropane-fatty-acyl-phospholipid synthase family protein [Gaiellales bacterium]
MGGLTLTAAPPRRAPVRSRVARALFERALARLRDLEVIAPDGSVLRSDPGAPRMEIVSERFFDRLGVDGKIGFGEAYMAGDWRTGDLPGVLLAFARGLTSLIPAPFQRLRALYEPSRPAREANTEAGARRNIQRHYDLSNDLFALFLDETMTYSCAVFEPGDTLADAQRRKYRAIAEMAALERDHHVLEIGTGWGGMAIHAASEIGCRVTTITISEEQHAFARHRVAEAGLAGRVEVLLRDYREMEGRFDRIVSIEMFEALGEEYWPVFFAACDRLLAPGGRMALQTITMPHDRYRASRRSYTWMHKYIFPGGLIPSEQAIDGALRKASRLRAVERRQIGQHYGPTLQAWRERFLAHWDDVRALGFDDTFRRTWEFYLAYCEAGFRAGALGDVQLALERP